MKGLLKGFWWPFRLSKLVKYSWSYGPNEICDNALVIYEITNQSPKTWDDYLKLLMQAYKALHPDKTQGAIFGPEAIEEKSGEKKNLDAMEIDKIQRKEGKSLQYC